MNKPMIDIKRNKLSLKDYLLGGNDKLIGTILGFKKGLKMKNYNDWARIDNWNFIFKKSLPITGKWRDNFLPEGFSVLLYFDHRTCRIERHLFNPNLRFRGKEPLVYLSEDLSKMNIIPKNPYLFNAFYKNDKPIIEFKNDEVDHYSDNFTMDEIMNISFSFCMMVV